MPSQAYELNGPQTGRRAWKLMNLREMMAERIIRSFWQEIEVMSDLKERGRGK